MNAKERRRERNRKLSDLRIVVEKMAMREAMGSNSAVVEILGILHQLIDIVRETDAH